MSDYKSSWINKSACIKWQRFMWIFWFVKPKGWSKHIKIEALEKQALTETDERKKTLYKIMSDMCKLKADYIRPTETDQEPQHRESQDIIRNVVENN